MFNDYNDDDAFPSSFFGGLRPTLGGFMNPNRGFSENYRCFPVAMMQNGNERESVNYGGKIILPQSALEKLSQLNISYPMLFKLIHGTEKKHSHAGVLEFIAEEGRVYLPQWMMETLGTEPGSIIEVKNVTLPLGSFVKIQPQSTDFLDITDHRAVLEKALRNFSTLTVGDIIQINYNNKIYEIKVLEVKPNYQEHLGISIVETDLEVDFAPPVGYVEPSKAPAQMMKSQMVIDLPKPVKTEFTPFSGGGQSLRGKNKAPARADTLDSTSEASNQGEDDGPLNLPFGQLYFGFSVVPPPSKEDELDENKKHVFTGSGQTLRPKKK
ncbi:ubiquitin fusion degradation protein UFD1-domain-containing protein [Gilbertella persicaria]|uniref:Ubiquitin fusion degradation protein 1 n=1 Tax=Rhizopus stolonifer TaxID=4846 RepID=A0A367KNE0_RHIST|nr:ubiquitin fusion degradation protein UFD1-domain-containing protein [Gilbertella persicaria]KAI8061843.1 ubiquitin fusion degradation protein UFD1-domain-containing protein [Gilbertella persicaria]RCI03362.1 ubiquitin fusion degradation protein [Rhizopus stolonifer]